LSNQGQARELRGNTRKGKEEDMGMDVYGNKPDSKIGEYFCNSGWSWHPLWNYCEIVAPMLTKKVKYGHSNDGDGLNKQDSLRLAEILEQELSSERTKAYAQRYKADMDALPDEKCKYCNGTGDRKDLEPAEWKKKCGGCNACHGKGKVRPTDTFYPFDTDNIREFVKFLAHCGGFAIN
jgi:DnaJ-class molecular chaperone